MFHQCLCNITEQKDVYATLVQLQAAEEAVRWAELNPTASPSPVRPHPEKPAGYRLQEGEDDYNSPSNDRSAAAASACAAAIVVAVTQRPTPSAFDAFLDAVTTLISAPSRARGCRCGIIYDSASPGRRQW